MQHRRPRFSKKAKTLLATGVARAAAAGVTVTRRLHQRMIGARGLVGSPRIGYIRSSSTGR